MKLTQNLSINMMLAWFCTLSFVSIVFFCSSLYAHRVGQSYVFMSVYDDALTGRFEITLSDLNRGLNLVATDEQLTEANLNDRIPEAFDYLREKVQFYEGENPLSIRFSGHSTRKLKIGQVIFIAFIFPVLFFVRKYAFYPQILLRYGAAAMILVASFWFVERTFLVISLAELLKKSLSIVVT